jgi:AraC family transcriptional regulator
VGGGADRLEYEQRVNRVIDHVRAHLAEDLSLDRLARVATFSPFHFHRIFRALTGEPLSAFIQRLRVERAAVALTYHRDQSVLAVALDHGFSSAATFARAFRAHFGMSATQWRTGGAERWSKQSKTNRKVGKARMRAQRHTASRLAKEASMKINVKTLPGFHVAYMRYVGPFGPHGIPETWTRLRQWMKTHNLDGPDSVKIGIGHDDPHVTAPEKCRYDACVVVPDSLPVDKHVNLADVPAGRYAVAAFTGSAHEIGDAWNALYRTWLPSSGYQPDDRPCLEIYRGDPMDTARPGVFHCELCVPVKPL